MEEGSHRLTLQQREKLTLTGVSEVVSFDEAAVVLHTELGTLTVRGKELQLQTLSLEGGQVEIQGRISELSYEEPREGGWLSRLLR